jgi:hypothetical protein
MNRGNSDNAVYIIVKVIPNASKDAVDGWEEDRLKIRIRAVAEKGKANKQLIGFLAEKLKIPKARLSIQSGETSRIKRIRIKGVSMEEIHALFL